MSSQNNKEDSGHIKAAVIGGVFALVAAIIGGLFLVLNTMVDNGIIIFGMSNPSTKPIVTVVQSPESIIASMTSTSAIDASAISLPSAPLYDDFEDSTISNAKWDQPTWENPQQYTPIQSQGSLRFEIFSKWFDWAVKQPQNIEEIYALVTLDSVNDGAFGLSLRTIETGFSYSLMLKKNDVAIWNNLKDVVSIPINDTCCLYAHLLGIVTDGSQIHFYVDNNLIGSYPYDGYPNYGTLHVDGPTRTVASVSDVWIRFRP